MLPILIQLHNAVNITWMFRLETNQFYKALSQVGTDFTMMALVMPMRSRKELKVSIETTACEMGFRFFAEQVQKRGKV